MPWWRSTSLSAAPEAGSRDPVARGRRVLELEAKAVAGLAERLGPEFGEAVDLILGAKGRVVASGVGKSGLVARKVAATLTSTGTPSLFLHPVEGVHGDLGLVGPQDVMLLFSKSGATPELDGLVEFAHRYQIPFVAFTGAPGSRLAKRARVVLDCAVPEEACSLDLAPTSSTTAAMAMGDALAVALLDRRGFGPEDFAALHPGGSLGLRLNLTVESVMESEDLPTAEPEDSVRALIGPLARRRGTVAVVSGGHLVGVVTAGDVTRLMEENDRFLDERARDVMTAAPKVAAPDERAASALRRMEEHGIMALPVVQDGTLVGMVHLHDLMRAGVE
ncbi:MAG: KpsF/GutQ family sugar-phosphate isomerase [Gemmatimonadetes bacterium]|nr:KpsF/GutQ family sugar-phosphate isomerase [Gemmatimonadota bacterium]